MKARRFKTTVIITAILAAAKITAADSVSDSVHEANKLYDKGNFSDALKEYDQALVDRPQSLEPKFNKANCYFRLDDLARAMDLYNEVAAECKNMGLVAKAKYNLGNCHFQRGSKQKDSDLQKALEDLQNAIVCWRSVLEMDPENEKAAKNIEVARLIIKDIIDRINRQKEEQRREAEKQKQPQEQSEELDKQQEDSAGETQQNQEQMRQEQQKQAQQPQEPNQPGREQLQQQEQQAAAVSDTTAQEILDKEQREKRQRQMLQQGGYRQAEKDW